MCLSVCVCMCVCVRLGVCVCVCARLGGWVRARSMPSGAIDARITQELQPTLTCITTSLID